MKVNKVHINSIGDLRKFVADSTNENHIKEVCSKALKICYIQVTESNLKDIKEQTLHFIDKYCLENSKYVKAKFIVIGWKLNYHDIEK
jgi:hypothetical protein